MTDLSYLPEQTILTTYAHVLVEVGLQNLQPEQVVEVIFPTDASPLAREIQKVLLQKNVHPLWQMYDVKLQQDFYKLSTEKQLRFFPQHYWQKKAELLSHQIVLLQPQVDHESSETLYNKQLYRETMHLYTNELQKKEHQNQFSWTMGLWGSKDAAKRVHLSEQDYWKEIFSACLLETEDAVCAWKKTFQSLQYICQVLTNMKIHELHIVGEHIDLHMNIGPERKWLGGRGRNLPSFEVFTSPIWQSVTGWIYCDIPLYRLEGNIEGCRFEFERGHLKHAHAQKGNNILQMILSAKGMDKVGEFSLTDRRISPIKKPLGVTLIDENIGGQFGNTHIALGKGFKESYTGKIKVSTSEEWQSLGINQGVHHLDFISSTDRTVTATLASGEVITVYKSGEFTVPQISDYLTKKNMV